DEVPLLAVPSLYEKADSGAAHPSACHFAEERSAVVAA
ncbi:peptide ABC transporter ATP-binding protein, partial [Streptomyces albus]|nr:peptide ABC transporter ATP-binding protein [Streptomyces albus]